MLRHTVSYAVTEPRLLGQVLSVTNATLARVKPSETLVSALRVTLHTLGPVEVQPTSWSIVPDIRTDGSPEGRKRTTVPVGRLLAWQVPARTFTAAEELPLPLEAEHRGDLPHGDDLEAEELELLGGVLGVELAEPGFEVDDIEAGRRHLERGRLGAEHDD